MSIFTSFKRISIWACLCILVCPVLVYYSYSSLYGVAYSFLDSDMSWLIMEADRFKQGEFPVFYHRIWYGGNTIGWLRAFVTSIIPININGYDVYQSKHLFFTFFMNPLLMVWASYFLVSRYFNSHTAFFVAIICSFGFDQWVQRIGFDLHVGYYVLGCILLGLRSSYVSNPFLEASYRKLFLLAFISGLAIYTFRSSLLYFIVFWIPFAFLYSEFKKFISPKNMLNKSLFVVFCIFIFLFFYLEIYSDQVGTLFGRKIKIHASPNLDVAVIIFSLYLFLNYIKFLIEKKFYYKRLIVFAGGFLVGFFPEILNYILTGKAPESGMWGKNGFKEFFELFALVPRAFADLISHHQSQDILRHSSLILFIFSLLVFFIFYRKDKRMLPFYILSILCVIAFCRVRPFSPGASRYLFPIFPIFILSIASMFDYFANRKQVLIIAFIFILSAGNVIHQFNLRSALITSYREVNNQDNFKKINEVFKKNGVKLVYSSEYLFSNTLTFSSSKEISYVTKTGLYPEFVENYMSSNLENFGVLIHSKDSNFIFQQPDLSFLEIQYKVNFIDKIGDFYLYSINNIPNI